MCLRSYCRRTVRHKLPLMSIERKPRTKSHKKLKNLVRKVTESTERISPGNKLVCGYPSIVQAICIETSNHCTLNTLSMRFNRINFSCFHLNARKQHGLSVVLLNVVVYPNKAGLYQFIAVIIGNIRKYTCNQNGFACNCGFIKYGRPLCYVCICDKQLLCNVLFNLEGIWPWLITGRPLL
jgi:hypothetical protein